LTTGDNKGIPETRKMRRKTVKFNKTDIRYWESRVAFHMPASRSYSVQIQHGGERRWLGLGTANKKDAAALALKLYLDVRSKGWEVVMRQRRGDPADKKVNVTIGEYIEAVAGRSLFSPKTLGSYAQALRKIALVGEGETLGLSPSRDMIHDQKTVYGSWVTSIWLMEDLVERIVRWRIHPEDLVTNRFPLEKAGEAYALMASGKSGKVAVVFDEESQ
jgi:hypothetical protein